LKVVYDNNNKTYELICDNCGKTITFTKNDIKLKPISKKNRSSIELYIEKILKEKYDYLEILYNENIEGFELDIFIPSLSLAFEINGPTHYNAIYGKKSLANVHMTGIFKKEMCIKNKINLITIDISHIKNFKNSSEKTKNIKMKFNIDMIISIINNALDEIGYNLCSY
jgi:hypothetical protein